MLKKGQRVVIMLWPIPTEGKADKGKPKPRLNYDEGTAAVLRVLRDAEAQGRSYMRRDELETGTGYNACQIRAFCKRLEAQGLLYRAGKFRGMVYGLITREEE